MMLRASHQNRHGIEFDLATGQDGDRCDVCGLKIGRLALEASDLVVCGSACAEQIRPCATCGEFKSPADFDDDAVICFGCLEADDEDDAPVPALVLVR